jgi:hypothetical protein
MYVLSKWTGPNCLACLNKNGRKKCSYITHSRTFFMFVWPFIVTNSFIMKPARSTNFPNLLRHETLHVSGSSSAHHQKFIHCTLGTDICHTVLKSAFEQDQDGPARNWLQTSVPSVKWINSWWWAEELPETCRVSCRSKFGKFVHLVGFIIKKIQ